LLGQIKIIDGKCVTGHLRVGVGPIEGFVAVAPPLECADRFVSSTVRLVDETDTVIVIREAGDIGRMGRLCVEQVDPERFRPKQALHGFLMVSLES
jgi:hypothetical protein